MAAWIEIARVGEVKEGFGKYIEVGERQVALFYQEGTYRAVDNLCPHMAGPLSAGDVNGSIVVCPWHGWEFDLKTGQCLNIAHSKVETFALKIEDGRILVYL
jgi:nitrite reductase (NADH) small subunit